MAQLIVQPSPRDLLPPLLACLPASFASPRPPPALLPLLSPILRQRVQLLASSNSASESWLPLLCWDRQRAAKLPQIVQTIQLEPHPVSGEFELDDVRATGYRRLDKETLHARFELDQFGLLPIYLWCENDEAGGGTGWRLAEVRALEDLDDGTGWFGSIEEANRGAGARGAGTNGINGHAEPVLAGGGDADEDEDDDSYWAAYDRTPGRTPAKRSPAPNTGRPSSIQLPTTSELEYFARYAAEVQPAMDPHDPDEEDAAAAAAGGSTLNGDSITRGMPAPQPEVETVGTTDLGSLSRDSAIPAPLQPNGHSESGRDRTNTTTSNLSAPVYNDAIESPRPSSSASSLSGSVARLQQQAEDHSQAEVGIKQHISTDIKSLFRLARSAGIERAEFERIVRTELDCLGLMDMEQ